MDVVDKISDLMDEREASRLRLAQALVRADQRLMRLMDLRDPLLDDSRVLGDR